MVRALLRDTLLIVGNVGALNCGLAALSNLSKDGSTLWAILFGPGTLVPLHRGFDRLIIKAVGAAVVSSAPIQPVKITVQRH